MKATRRHELRENDLAHAIDTGKEYLREHAGRLGLLLLVVISAIAVVGITVRTRADNIERAWAVKGKLLFDSPEAGRESLDKLRALTTETADESFALISLIEQGSQALRLAQEVESPPDIDLNNRARAAFESLLERFPGNTLAYGLAHSGLATVAENDFAIDSDLSHRAEADGHLQAIVDNPGLNSLPFHRMASDRLAKLNDTFTIIRFASPAEPEEPVPTAQADEPIMITPTPVPADEVPTDLKIIAGSADEGVYGKPGERSADDSAGAGEGASDGQAIQDVPGDAGDESEDTP